MKKRYLKRICHILFFLCFCLLLPGRVSAAKTEEINILNQTEISVLKGGRYRLTGVEDALRMLYEEMQSDAGLTSDGQEKLVWTSSRKSVATVNQKGRITAKKKGTTVITVTLGSASFSCKVRVYQPVTKVTLNKKSRSMTIGKSYTLKATVKPSGAYNKTLLWSSSDPSVAAVDSSGKVTALSAGTAVITAMASDGSGKQAVCKIKVRLPAITLSQSSLSIEAGACAQLTVSYAQNSLIWTSSDDLVASVSSDGLVSGNKEGSAVITVQEADSADFLSCSVTVLPASESETASTENGFSGTASSEITSSGTASSGTSPETEYPQSENSETEPSKSEETKSSGTAAAVSENAKRYLAILQKYSEQVQSDYENGNAWTYSNSKTSASFWLAVSSGNRKSNCALMCRWALKEMGVLGSSCFYGKAGGGIYFGGTSRQELEVYCDIIKVNKTPNELLKEGNLLPGDICTYVDYQHTNVYAGDGLWYDSGRGANYSKSEGVFQTFGPGATISMSGTTISYIIRFR